MEKSCRKYRWLQKILLPVSLPGVDRSLVRKYLGAGWEAQLSSAGIPSLMDSEWLAKLVVLFKVQGGNTGAMLPATNRHSAHVFSFPVSYEARSPKHPRQVRHLPVGAEEPWPAAAAGHAGLAPSAGQWPGEAVQKTHHCVISGLIDAICWSHLGLWHTLLGVNTPCPPLGVKACS